MRAFNTIFLRDLKDQAHRAAPRLAIPLMGDDEGALRLTEGLIADAGFDTVRAGSLALSRRIDPGAPVYGKSLSANELTTVLASR